jgi:hypothetical protein
MYTMVVSNSNRRGDFEANTTLSAFNRGKTGPNIYVTLKPIGIIEHKDNNNNN